MPASAIGGFLLYCLVNAFTPGPGNLLALSTITNFGWRRGRPLFLGIFAGYYAVQLICAALVYGVGALLPSLLGAMKYAGAAYILYLAIHIARSRPGMGSEGRQASFWRGFALQFVNVKIYLFGVTALSGYVTPYNRTLWVLVLFELGIATIGSIATLSWIAAGAAMQRFYLRHCRAANILMALILLECAYSILTA